jgi:uncharacterized DUF497 family protein
MTTRRRLTSPSKVSFNEAQTGFRDPEPVAFYGAERNEGEDRELLIGDSDQGRLLIVSYTPWESVIRLLSAAMPPGGKRTLRKEYDLKALSVAAKTIECRTALIRPGGRRM